MKILLSWIFDYIDSSFASVDVKQLVHLFNTHTAEIEHFEKSIIPVDTLFLVQIAEISPKKMRVLCPEIDQNIDLSFRSDAVLSKWYLIKKDGENYSWVSFADLKSEKEGLFGAVSVDKEQLNGSWRNEIVATDYILEVDNKSINHRPDLWGHYGIAREIAALLNLKLKPLDDVLQKQSVMHFDQVSKKSSQGSFQVSIEDVAGCSRFAGIYGDVLNHKDSDLGIAIRLTRVGSKPIDAMIDLTNYVMFDVGHPMHVFDAQAFADKTIIVRKAHKGEKITVLDGSELSLTDSDMIVANDKKPVALAGIMGGKDSGFSSKTKSIFLEAAGFHPTTIRLTAQRFKLRTEASARFEKHLDPMQNVIALKRFLYLAQQRELISNAQEAIISVGKVIEPATFVIAHDFIEKRIGIHIESDFIVQSLQKLGFEVSLQKNDQGLFYHVLIPTYRMTKDVRIKEDILEEIVRMYGYDKITYQPVMRPAEPFDTHEIRNIANIKKHLAFACNMHEVRDYLFFDEAFIKRLQFNPTETISVRNPGSENWTRLVTSLVPHLIKNVESNVTKKDHLRFFEWNRIWRKTTQNFVEKSCLAGIIFDKKHIDFYESKAELQGLWNQLGLTVTWSKPAGEVASWYDKNKAAQLFVGSTPVGIAGMVSPQFLKPVLEGSAFVFELDADFLASFTTDKKVFKAWSKYQEVTYDISLMVPLKVTADELKGAILNANPCIIAVDLVDFFEKDEWVDQRALTFRYTMSDAAKTLQKQDIDEVVHAVVTALEKYHVHIR